VRPLTHPLTDLRQCSAPQIAFILVFSIPVKPVPFLATAKGTPVEQAIADRHATYVDETARSIHTTERWLRVAIAVESPCDPHAEGLACAMGLMRSMPSSGAEIRDQSISAAILTICTTTSLQALRTCGLCRTGLARRAFRRRRMSGQAAARNTSRRAVQCRARRATMSSY
jgi:hypothetical protein